MRTSRCSVTRPVHNQVILKVILNKHCCFTAICKEIHTSTTSLPVYLHGRATGKRWTPVSQRGRKSLPTQLDKICDLLISFTARLWVAQVAMTTDPRHDWCEFTAQDSSPNISGVVDQMLVTDKGSPSKFQQCSTYYI